ncbi:ATP-binding protein [Thermomonospora amylolytica]|uniref:ATP-binding protein n=1 Tax=Thermomonospora amylolytica TaxID=1411117 RepID=UPI0013004546|nr:ATP-binding protein [Thermomonospora amylolytica]
MNQDADRKGVDELQMPMAASPASAGLAWSLVEARLIRWGLDDEARYDARLILTELLANAIGVTPLGGHVTVLCGRDTAGVAIGVADRCPDVPPEPQAVVEMRPEDLDLRPERFDDNGGWGPAIVTALAAACGVTRLDAGGKIVWARLRA